MPVGGHGTSSSWVCRRLPGGRGQGHVALVLLAQLVVEVLRAQAAVAAIGRGTGTGLGVVAALRTGHVSVGYGDKGT